MASERTIDASWVRSRIGSDHFGLFILAAVYVIIVSSLAVLDHRAFNTNTWDLGIYSQALYTTLNHGRLLYYTAELPGNPSGSLFGIHFSPFLLLLTPIYALYQNPVTLLILRPIAIAVGLIPLHGILHETHLNSRVLNFLISIVYLLYPPVLVPYWNFDAEAFLPVLFLSTIYYLKKGDLPRAYLFLLLSLMVNEFVPFIVISLALYFFLLHREEIIRGLRRGKLTKNALFSLLLLASGILWLKLAYAVITYFNPTALSTKWEWGELGTGPGEIVINLLTHPVRAIAVLLNDWKGKLRYIVWLIGPLSFLSLLDPLTLIPTLPWLAASLLSINPIYYDIISQYPAFISAFVFASGINGMKRLEKIGGAGTLRTATFLLLAALIMGALSIPTEGRLKFTAADQATRIALTRIPRDASASVMPEALPHICNRLEVYPYYRAGVDYVLINVRSWWYTCTLPRPAHTAPRWCDVEIGDEYGIVLNAEGVVLYERGYNGPILFEGVNLTYASDEVGLASGKIAQEEVIIGNRLTKANVLVHEATDPATLFFRVPRNALPPGNYNLTAIFKVSSATPGEVVTLEIMSGHESWMNGINGTDFARPDEWQAFNFNFTSKQPTFTEISVHVTNSTDVYFYSMNVLQVRGSA